MRRLTVLVAVILIAGLLSGCFVTPELILVGIDAKPEEMTFLNKKPEPIESVTAIYKDESTKDIALEDCIYESSDTGIVTVDNKGLITPVLKGEAIVLVSYSEYHFWTGLRIKTDEVKITVGK